MPTVKKYLTLTRRGEELKAALKAFGERILYHDTDRLYLQVFVDMVVVTIDDRDLAELQRRFPALHIEDVHVMGNQSDPPRERCTLELVGRGAELKAALDALGPRVRVHDFSAFIGMADVSVEKAALAELQQRFPRLEVRLQAEHPAPKRSP